MRRKVMGMFSVLLVVLFLATAAGGCGRSTPETARPSEHGQAKPPVAGDPQGAAPALELAGKKILLVVAPRDFRDEEFFVPRRIFEEKGAVVTVASREKKTATGMLGGTVNPELAFSEVRAADWDAVVVAGGTGSKEFLWNDGELRMIVQKACGQKKVVAAICLSPVVLARAGCLAGKEATIYPDPSAVRELEAAGAARVDEGVVVAGNVVTAKGPQEAEAFALAVARLLAGRRD